jgi:hypothetical protein
MNGRLLALLVAAAVVLGILAGAWIFGALT